MVERDRELEAGDIIFIIILMIPTVLLLFVNVFRIISELRQYRFDLLKLTQYGFLLVHLLMWIAFYVSFMYGMPFFVSEILICIASAANMGYIVVNLILWILIIVHIPNLMKGVGNRPQELYQVIPKSRKVEILSIVTLIAIFTLSLGLNAWSTHSQILFHWKYHPNFTPQEIALYTSIFFFGCFFIIEIYLFGKLMPIIEKYGYFDKRNRKFFRILFVGSLIYYIVQIGSHTIGLIIGFTFCSLSEEGIYFYDFHENVLWYFVLLFLNNNFPVLYAYLNIRNVSFNKYLGLFLDGIRKRDVGTSEGSLFVVSSGITYGHDKESLLSSEDVDTHDIDSTRDNQYYDSFLQEDLAAIDD